MALLETGLIPRALILGNRTWTEQSGISCFVANGSVLKACRLYKKPGFQQEQCATVWCLDDESHSRTLYPKPAGMGGGGCGCALQ